MRLEPKRDERGRLLCNKCGLAKGSLYNGLCIDCFEAEKLNPANAEPKSSEPTPEAKE